MNQMRLALRSLRKNTGFSRLVILTLALGIGTSTAMFSAVPTGAAPAADPVDCVRAE